MVKVRSEVPRTPQGEINLPLWVDRLCDEHEQLDSQALEAVAARLAAQRPDLVLMGIELAELVAELNMDQASVHAALIYRGVREGRLGEAAAVEIAGREATSIATAVAAMATTSLLELSNSPLLEKEQQSLPSFRKFGSDGVLGSLSSTWRPRRQARDRSCRTREAQPAESSPIRASPGICVLLPH